MKTLIIRPGAIGDFIVSLPAMEHLKDGWTEVWCAEQNVPLARFGDSRRSIISAGLDRVAILNAEDCLERLRKFDRIHSWYGGRRDDFREAVRALPFRFYEPLPNQPGMHATAFYCAQVGAAVSEPRIEVPRTGPRRNSVVIHPFASSGSKRWPLGHFQELERLLKPLSVEWCAGPEEPLEGAHRFENLYELAAWLAGAKCFVGNDSGIAHLAAAVETPSVIIFGPTDPAVWAPKSSHVRVISRSPIASIQPGEIAGGVWNLL